MNGDTRDKLANARALAAEVVTGQAATGQTERDLLMAIERVRRLANPKETEWVLELCAAYLKTRKDTAHR